MSASRGFGNRFLSVLVVIAFLTACGTIATPTPGGNSVGATLDSTSRLDAGLKGAGQALDDSAGVNASDADQTERAVGYLAIAAGVVALTIIFIGFYKLGKILFLH